MPVFVFSGFTYAVDSGLNRRVNVTAREMDVGFTYLIIQSFDD